MFQVALRGRECGDVVRIQDHTEPRAVRIERGLAGQVHGAHATAGVIDLGGEVHGLTGHRARHIRLDQRLVAAARQHLADVPAQDVFALQTEVAFMGAVHGPVDAAVVDERGEINRGRVQRRQRGRQRALARHRHGEELGRQHRRNGRAVDQQLAPAAVGRRQQADAGCHGDHDHHFERQRERGRQRQQQRARDQRNAQVHEGEGQCHDGAEANGRRAGEQRHAGRRRKLRQHGPRARLHRRQGDGQHGDRAERSADVQVVPDQREALQAQQLQRQRADRGAQELRQQRPGQQHTQELARVFGEAFDRATALQQPCANRDLEQRRGKEAERQGERVADHPMRSHVGAGCGRQQRRPARVCAVREQRDAGRVGKPHRRDGPRLACQQNRRHREQAVHGGQARRVAQRAFVATGRCAHWNGGACSATSVSRCAAATSIGLTT